DSKGRRCRCSEKVQKEQQGLEPAGSSSSLMMVIGPAAPERHGSESRETPFQQELVNGWVQHVETWIQKAPIKKRIERVESRIQQPLVQEALIEQTPLERRTEPVKAWVDQARVEAGIESAHRRDNSHVGSTSTLGQQHAWTRRQIEQGQKCGSE